METMSSATTMTSTRFDGPEVLTGSVTAVRDTNGITLAWSDDFVIPMAPAPHWQVVDGNGNAYLLQRLQVANDRVNRTIRVPSHVRSVAQVRVYCAFAEVVLGEASFSTPVM